jgi:hypothetical protein
LHCNAQTNSQPGVFIVDGTGISCPARYYGQHGETATQIRRVAKRNGWAYLPGYRWELCPEHAPAWTTYARSSALLDD